MMGRRTRLLVAALLVGTAAPAISVPALAEPDFTGTYERYPAPGEEADPRYAPNRPGEPPLRPEYLADYRAYQAVLASRAEESQPAGENYIRCIPDGMPAMMMGMFPMEIFQRDEQINITQEAFNQTRRIYMNQELPRWDEVNPGFFGASVGHWEGDTLVIRTTGIKQSVEFQWTPHSEAMVITERISLLSPDILHNEITVEDEFFERPWTYSYSYRRMPGYRLQEYVCEDNRDYVDENGNHTMRLPGE
jgi:hypothetical protein